MVEAESPLIIRRGFGWGIVMLLDSGDPVPILESGLFGATRTGLTVAVRHAADVNAEVLEALRYDDEVPPFEVTVRV